MYNPQRTQRGKKGEVVTMTVHILDNFYSKRVKGQSCVMFSHYNGDVYSSLECAMKILTEMAKSVSADPECYNVVFDADGSNLHYRWKNLDGDEFERNIQIESKEVK